MRALLHILTQSNDPLAEQIIAEQQHFSDYAVEIVDLTAPAPDYRELVRAIFRADSVHVW